MYEQGFSEIYDKLQDADYNGFVEFYKKVFKKFGLNPTLILDLACGTGNITRKLAKAGYDMTGVDLSVEMLNIAREKAEKEGLDILFLNQDMTDFELYGTVDAIISSLDGINYLTQNGDLEKVFNLCRNYLNPGGLMIFDINSSYKLKEIIGNNTFVCDEEDTYYVWQNEYIEEENVCCFALDIFIKRENGAYERFSEFQEERAYSKEEICSAAEVAGFEVLGCYSGFDFEKTNDKTERLFFVIKNKETEKQIYKG